MLLLLEQFNTSEYLALDVSLAKRGRGLGEAVEALPCGLLVAFPLHFEL